MRSDRLLQELSSPQSGLSSGYLLPWRDTIKRSPKSHLRCRDFKTDLADLVTYHLSEVFCIDFEASSLSANGYPIEVGIADAAAGNINSWLVLPTKSWTIWGHWDNRAEAVHRIARDWIERDGLPVPEVIEAINNLGLTGGTVLSDCPRHDNKWLEDLYRAGGYSNSPFVIGDLEAFAARFAQQCGILSDAAMWRALEEATMAFPDNHRAGLDARRGVELLHRLHEAGASLANFTMGRN